MFRIIILTLAIRNPGGSLDNDGLLNVNSRIIIPVDFMGVIIAVLVARHCRNSVSLSVLTFVVNGYRRLSVSIGEHSQRVNSVGSFAGNIPKADRHHNGSFPLHHQSEWWYPSRKAVSMEYGMEWSITRTFLTCPNNKRISGYVRWMHRLACCLIVSLTDFHSLNPLFYISNKILISGPTDTVSIILVRKTHVHTDPIHLCTENLAFYYISRFVSNGRWRYPTSIHHLYPPDLFFYLFSFSLLRHETTDGVPCKQ